MGPQRACLGRTSERGKDLCVIAGVYGANGNPGTLLASEQLVATAATLTQALHELVEFFAQLLQTCGLYGHALGGNTIGRSLHVHFELYGSSVRELLRAAATYNNYPKKGGR